tara:strand:- start:3866 stop:4492 length:627 start_codon:yes stop_codon:yes gene_type:complete
MALKKEPKIPKEKVSEDVKTDKQSRWIKPRKPKKKEVGIPKKPNRRRPRPCPTGTIRKRGKCIRKKNPGPPSRNPCRGHKCPPGFKCIAPADSPKCVRKKGGPKTPRKCKPGYKWNGKRCVKAGPKTPKKCRPGYKWNGKRCVKGGRDPRSCRPGYKWNGKRCIKVRGGGSNPGGGSKCSSILSKISSLKKQYAMCKKKGRGPKIYKK